MDIIFFLTVIAAIVAALEPGHHRTFRLPRAPFGSDAHVDHDVERVLHDLRS